MYLGRLFDDFHEDMVNQPTPIKTSLQTLCDLQTALYSLLARTNRTFSQPFQLSNHCDQPSTDYNRVYRNSEHTSGHQNRTSHHQNRTSSHQNITTGYSPPHGYDLISAELDNSVQSTDGCEIATEIGRFLGEILTKPAKNLDRHRKFEEN